MGGRQCHMVSSIDFRSKIFLQFAGVFVGLWEFFFVDCLLEREIDVCVSKGEEGQSGVRCFSF